MTVAALRPSRLPDLELRTPTSVDELARLVADGFRAYAGGSDILLEAAQQLTLAAGPSLTEARRERAGAAQVDLRAAVDSVFGSHDLIATPAASVPAFPLGERPGEVDGVPVDSLWGAFPLAVPFNVSGHETLLLDVAEQLEEALALELWCHLLPAGSR